MGKYDKIIFMQRPVDKKHPPMSMHNRAAQFAPFDALTGLERRMNETQKMMESTFEAPDSSQLQQ